MCAFAAQKLTLMDPSVQSLWKKAAAEAAAALVEDGMVVGLGTGSTAAYFVSALGRRIADEGLAIVGIPTSQETAALALGANVPLTTFADHMQIDLAVDGADEIEMRTHYLIKGHGGALLREKIVAAASQRMVVVADETKLVAKLGSKFAVPVEIVQFGWEATLERLARIGGKPTLRVGKDKNPFITDGGNYIVDCAFGPIDNPLDIAQQIDSIVGAIEHGLFLGFVREAIIGGSDGVKILRKS